LIAVLVAKFFLSETGFNVDLHLAWVARVALFRASLGPAAGVPDCPVLNLLIAVFLLFYQERNTDK